jgi:hypothetical protein
MNATPASQAFDHVAGPTAQRDGELMEMSASRRGLAAVLLAVVDYVLTALASPAPGGESGEFIDESWPATGAYSFWGSRRGRYL